ncbi:6-phosphogluconolactonase [Microbacterium sp. STN6]|uniref:6-phosphogluconolactonase n=1 Tax=Microbacterium sp. STN6 TaxID=2995588 RepID=UPI0022609EA7|nr:6-phosphogluconolactonase [Microbacterium sp. STN6]MCX7522980.1 6-phosphogluconolactonase [Microbacterium sp. STN6]
MDAPHVFADADALGGAVADEIVSGLAAAVRDGRDYLLGAPSGRTPRSTYTALAARIAAHPDLDLGRLKLVMMDDYVVTDDEGSPRRVSARLPYSCERFARDEILAALNAAAERSSIPESNLWFPDPEDPAAYDEAIEQSGGIDFFILATGASDGHVAFNPPGSSRDSRTRVVTLSRETRRDNMQTFHPHFARLEDVPRFGITVGIDTISRFSRRAVMLAVGEGKRPAVARLLEADGYDPTWPATIVFECKDYDIFVDEAAYPGAARAGAGSVING